MGLIIFIGLAVLLSPALMAIIQVIVGVSKGVGAFGKVLVDLLGPIGSWMSNMGAECENDPGSWKCWVFYVGTGILPIFGGLIQAWRKGKFQNTTNNIAELTSQHVDQVAKDACDKFNERWSEVEKKLTPEQRDNPEFVSAAVTRLVANIEKERLDSAQNQSQLADEDKKEQQNELTREKTEATTEAEEGLTPREKEEVQEVVGEK